ncbi:hypothetical protein BCO18175_07404 [Burkholderia contaminans]|uniref:hypothetical protein n=1 Tax=Burkholderia contaminans TaxID=488447 RepID=UPI00145437E5|nr:hypothetical protein [Burkholderia contaminans]VWD48187.1 hypothetical protein BCO18175_07404 [Burkholderia contaminans]
MPPTNDLTDPHAMRHELLDSDQGVRDGFAQHLGAELDALAAGLAQGFEHLQPILDVGERLDLPRTNLMIAFALGVIDDLVVSAKLLLAGQLPASGNVMRQALEGLAMAILCSTDALLVIAQDKKKGAVRASYWQKIMADDSRVQGQHALRQLAWNAELLGLSPAGVAFLQRVQKIFHPFSHCGRFTLASRAAVQQPGRVHLGGHFDAAKLDGYRRHLEQHIGLAGMLPAMLDHLLDTLPVPNAAPAARAPVSV